jgi:uncharacterized protein Smg (DUF494 family)
MRLVPTITVVEEGYTGQRDQFENHPSDAEVSLDDGGVVVLMISRTSLRQIKFERRELEKALNALDKLRELEL